MDFKEMKVIFQANFEELVKDADALFEVGPDKDKLWETYLDSFPAGTNEIFRERREHDCSCCRQFVRNIGAVVVIKNNEIHTIWEMKIEDETWQTVFDTMDCFVKDYYIRDIYFTDTEKIGTDKNVEESEVGLLTWHHFYLELPSKFVNKSHRSEGDVKGEVRATREVFERSLKEITEDSILTVLELIAQNSLYRGEESKYLLTEFLRYKQEYAALDTMEKQYNYTWINSITAGPTVGKIRNHSIGTLLTNISENMGLDLAVKKFEDIVAGPNYKRPKPIFTQKMLDDAKEKITELGYSNSLKRRFATLDDITVNNILFSNKDSAKRIAGDVFDEMSKSAAINPRKFERVEEISAEDFVKNVLPGVKELEVLLENKHQSNLVSLIAPGDKEAPTMFKWDNAFGWAYTGNITDSDIRENVKSAGGNVTGDLRFSIQWNDIEFDQCDLDAHCIEASGEEIAFNKCSRAPGRSKTGGQLDVDIVHPRKGEPAVENITWPSVHSMDNGTYQFFVHNYYGGNRTGFRAEIEFDGQLISFDYNQPTKSRQKTLVAEVTLENGQFSIKELIPSTNSSISGRELWGLSTNEFIPVSVVMYSPNYWDAQGVGNRHYFFMLKNCVNPECPNGFYNEFLGNELLEHKRVLEALGGKLAVEEADDQLSGLGFASTRRNELIVKAKGQSERVLRIKF